MTSGDLGGDRGAWKDRGDRGDRGDWGVEDPWGVPSVVHLRAAGTSLLLATDRRLLPRVLHWGGDLGALSVDDLEVLALAAGPSGAGQRVPAEPAVLPEVSPGWRGLAGLEVARGRVAEAVALRAVSQRLLTGADGSQALEVRAADERLGVDARLEVRLSPVAVLDVSVVVAAPRTLLVRGLRLALPVPAVAGTLLDPAGPARRSFTPGVHREGDRSHGAVGRAGAGRAGGEVWLVRATSAQGRFYAERLRPDPRVLGAELVGGTDGGLASPAALGLRAVHGHGLDAARARLDDG